MSATSGEGGSPDTQRSLAACLVRPLASPISPQAPNTHDPAKAKARLCIAAHTRASIPMSVATLPVRIQRNTATCRRHTTTARLRPATVGRNLPLLSVIQLRLAACRGHTPHHGKSLLRTKLLVRRLPSSHHLSQIVLTTVYPCLELRRTSSGPGTNETILARLDRQAVDVSQWAADSGRHMEAVSRRRGADNRRSTQSDLSEQSESSPGPPPPHSSPQSSAPSADLSASPAFLKRLDDALKGLHVTLPG